MQTFKCQFVKVNPINLISKLKLIFAILVQNIAIPQNPSHSVSFTSGLEYLYWIEYIFNTKSYSSYSCHQNEMQIGDSIPGFLISFIDIFVTPQPNLQKVYVILNFSLMILHVPKLCFRLSHSFYVNGFDMAYANKND